MKNIKVALAHEFLTQYGGAEKTFEVIAQMFPDAPIFTAKLDRKILPDFLKNRHFIFPENGIINKASKYLFTFLMAPVFESFDFGQYDLIISDGTTWNKGILTRPDQLHITYLHTPPRFLYKYSTESTKRNKWFFKLFFSYVDNIFRMWDFVAAQRPDHIIANSKEVQKRIMKFYRRESTVIYPPVELDYKISENSNNLQKPYYIIVGRLARYKNFDLAVQAFNLLDIPLVVVGTGSYEKYLRKIAKPNIIFKGRSDDQEKHNLIANSLGLINLVADEDFGIVPIEAMAHGIPVLVHKSGGHIESVDENINGMFVEDLSVETLVKKIKEFDEKVRSGKYDKNKIKETSLKYSKERFMKEFKDFVTEKWDIFQSESA